MTFASVYIHFTPYTDIPIYRNGVSPLMVLVWVTARIPGYLLWGLRSKRTTR